jgi:hypothetical protein
MQIVKNQPLETNWPVCVANLSNTDRRKLTCEGISSALLRAAALAPDVTIFPILKRFQEPQPDLKSDAVRGGIARGLCASAAEETARRA